MELLYAKEHLSCFNNENSEKPLIEVKSMVKGQNSELCVTDNEIVFFLDGCICFEFDDFPDYEAVKGQILFLPSGGTYFYSVQADTRVIILRILDSISLCENYRIERLYEYKKGQDRHAPETRSFSVLEMVPRVWHYVKGLNDCISDGIRCRYYSEMKIREFFLLLRTYYPKEDIHDFFYLILSGNTAFSEYVRLRWRQYHTVRELAASMHLSPKQFSTRFTAVFEKTPYRWMTEGKARIVQSEIVSTDKPFKQIALENGLSSDAQFTRFCRKELGMTPTEIRYGKTHARNNCKKKDNFNQ